MRADVAFRDGLSDSHYAVVPLGLFVCLLGIDRLTVNPTVNYNETLADTLYIYVSSWEYFSLVWLIYYIAGVVLV